MTGPHTVKIGGPVCRRNLGLTPVPRPHRNRWALSASGRGLGHLALVYYFAKNRP